MEFKAAIFDMDGTLIDSLMLWDILWSTFGERYLNDKSFVPDVEDDKRVRTLTLKDAMNMIHSKYNMAESGEELLSVANAIMIDFYANRVELKAGVREFLEHCKNKGIKMCIASATARDLLDVAMKHCDLEKYFLKIFSCAEIGKGKEEPDIFLKAIEFLGTDIKETCLFEDSLTAIETAAKIGLPSVGVYDRYNFGQDRIKEIALEYIAEDETLMKIIK